MEKLLVVVAHPDDAELMFGGTIHNYINENNEVYEIVVTDGSSWCRGDFINEKKLISQRKKECLESGKKLGINKIHFLDFKDGRITPEKICDKLVETIKKINPTIIATHGPFEGHHDHEIVYQSMCRICNTVNEPAPILNYLYDKNMPLTNFKGLVVRWLADHGIDENVSFVKLDEESVKAKFDSISCYKSQFAGADLEALLKRQKNLMKYCGDFCNCGYAECYKVINKEYTCSKEFVVK